MLRDVRYAWRSLRKAPAYTVAVILTLALGIGANTAVFNALYAVVLRPLPYRKPGELAIVALYNRNLRSATYLSYPDFTDWQQTTRTFASIAAIKPAAYDVTQAGTPKHVEGYEVSSNFLDTLGVRLAMGHSFLHNDDRVGGRRAAVISYRLWHEDLQARRDVLGQAVTLNGTGYEIAGVLPRDFRFEDQPVDVLTPLGQSDPLFLQDRTVHNILCVARLASGTTIQQAQAEMNAIQARIARNNPTSERGQGVSIVPLEREFAGETGPILFLLLGAVAFVLLISCANVANLLLARSTSRSREFAVRRALGASPVQIVWQLMVESMLLAVAGGVVGLLVAKLGSELFLRVLPGSLPRAEELRFSPPVLLYTLCIAGVAGIVFGLAPALREARSDLESRLRAGGRSSTARHRGTQAGLAVAQVALAVILLAGGGLLLQTVRKLWAVNPGFETQHVLTFQVGLAPALARTSESTRKAYKQLTNDLRAIPGVQSVGMTALLPLGRGFNSGPFWVGKRPPLSMAELPRATYYPTGPGYAQTLPIPLLRGRFLEEEDDTHSELVCLVDDVLARTYFGSGNAVGRSVTIPHWGKAGAVSARIVGVVRHVRQSGLDGLGREQPEIYYSLYQLPDEGWPIFRSDITFALRTTLRTAVALPALKATVQNLAEDQPLYNVRSMRDVLATSMSRQRLPMVLLLAFAGIALLLASVGIYGVLSYATTQRVPEIGVRIALGAVQRDVVRMVVTDGLRLTLTGVVLGTVGAIALTRTLSTFSRLLYGVAPTDPATLAAAALCLVCAALAACYLPAARASCVDPVSALRRE